MCPAILPLAALGLLCPTAPDWAGGLRRHLDAGRGRRPPGAGILPHRRARQLRRPCATGPTGPATSRACRHTSRSARSGRVRSFRRSIFTMQIRNRDPASTATEPRFEAELGWREFAYHLCSTSNPTSRRTRSARASPQSTGRATQPPSVPAWQKGQTGYPLVDAGMRELWQTGYAQPGAHGRRLVPDQASWP
jgi:deoxyribodipyrimidine photo-lyase